MKVILIIAITIFTSGTTYGQKAYLDIEKYAPCELFAEKSGYDWQQRLLQMDSLENQEVTVFEVKGKDNQIKKSYTGKLMNVWKKSGKTPSKGHATVITVRVDEGNGRGNAYFPLTNDKNYRIYLQSCLKQ